MLTECAVRRLVQGNTPNRVCHCRVSSSDTAQPKIVTMAAEDYKHLATISLRDFEDRKQEIAEQLFRSASTIGFFYIIGQRDVECCRP